MQLIISSTTLGRDAFSTCGRQVKLRNATGKATTTVLRIEINVLHCKERLNAMRNCRCWWVIFHGQKDTYIWDYSLLFLICLLTILFQYAEFFCGTIFLPLKGMFCQSKMYFTTLIKNVLLSYTLLLYCHCYSFSSYRERIMTKQCKHYHVTFIECFVYFTDNRRSLISAGL